MLGLVTKDTKVEVVVLSICHGAYVLIDVYHI